MPTYNRVHQLSITLASLRQQTFSAGLWEVIVIDDGSNDGTREMCADMSDLPLKYVWQPHLGGTAAKNRGVDESQSDLILFLDDDITVNKHYIESLANHHINQAKSISMGTLHHVGPDEQFDPDQLHTESSEGSCIRVPFTECLGGFIATKRVDFISLGMLQDPAPGFWPNWDDIDLAYRAEKAGFTFWRCKGAIGFHRDHVLADLDTECRRWEHAARSAVLLFRKHPGLRTEIPMFRDKGSIAWLQDPPKLVLRKLARQLVSSTPSMKVMQTLVTMMKQSKQPAQRLLKRWIVSGYIYRGYRKGLEEFAQKPKPVLDETTQPRGDNR